MDNLNLNNKTFDRLLEDAIVDIKVNAQFYSEVKKLFIELLNENETKESMTVIIDNITKDKVNSRKEHILYIFLSLLNQIESDAKAQNKIVRAPYPTIQDSPEN